MQIRFQKDIRGVLAVLLSPVCKA